MLGYIFLFFIWPVSYRPRYYCAQTC